MAVSIRNLDKIFKPNRVALLGLGANPADLGRRVLSNLLDAGFRGIVYPVSESIKSVSGVATYPGLQSLPNSRSICTINLISNRRRSKARHGSGRHHFHMFAFIS